MPITFIPASQVDEEIANEWASAGLLNSDAASILATVMFPIKTQVVDLFARIFEIHQAHRLSSAFGINLDEKAREFGVTRKTSEPAADYTYGNFRFTLPPGVVARDYSLDDGGFTISAGQYISDGSVQFVTLDDAIFSADSHSAFVRIQGLSSATSYVPENSLTEHSVTASIIDNLNLNETPEVWLLCTNDKAIELATLSEDDNSLRDRVYERVNSNGTNTHAILFALKTLGILDAEFIPDAFGAGTLGVRLITGEPVISDTTLIAADATIAAITPYARVMIPEYIVMKFQLSIEIAEESNLDATKADIITVIKTYINDIPAGNDFNLQALEDAISGIDNVVRHKLLCLFLNERKCLLSSHRAASDEKFLLSREDDAVTFSA